MNTFNIDPPESTGPRAAQRDATRAAILAAARLAFEADGFDGANIRDIAARAGVAAGTVIHHFGDKRELLHAALHDDLQRVLDGALLVLADDRDAGVDVGASLSRLASAVCGHYASRPSLSRAALRESLFADAPWAERFAAQTSATHRAVVDVIDAARARGAVAATVDPTLAAAAWLSFFYFGLIGWTQGQLASPESFIDALTRQHLGLPTTTTTTTTTTPDDASPRSPP